LTFCENNPIMEIMESPPKIIMVVKADRVQKTHRISIPKAIREAKGWENIYLYKITLREDGTVTLEGYLTYEPEIADRIDIEEEKVRELAENIREQGLLQSPLVRKVGNEYEIIAGDRRILAVKKLGWSEIECVVCQMTDAQAAEARASENLAREDLTVIEEARVYERLLKTYGYTIKQIAEKMGKSASYGVAEALWPISDPAALDYYLSFACDHGVTVPIARQWANDWKMSQRRLREDEDPMQNMEAAPAIRPTYIACDLCEQPELVEHLQIVRLCRECAMRIAQARNIKE